MAMVLGAITTAGAVGDAGGFDLDLPAGTEVEDTVWVWVAAYSSGPHELVQPDGWGNSYGYSDNLGFGPVAALHIADLTSPVHFGWSGTTPDRFLAIGARIPASNGITFLLNRPPSIAHTGGNIILTPSGSWHRGDYALFAEVLWSSDSDPSWVIPPPDRLWQVGAIGNLALAAWDGVRAYAVLPPEQQSEVAATTISGLRGALWGAEHGLPPAVPGGGLQLIWSDYGGAERVTLSHVGGNPADLAAGVTLLSAASVREYLAGDWVLNDPVTSTADYNSVGDRLLLTGETDVAPDRPAWVIPAPKASCFGTDPLLMDYTEPAVITLVAFAADRLYSPTGNIVRDIIGGRLTRQATGPR